MRRFFQETAVAKAVVDPNELRRFAAELKRFNATLQTEIVNIHRQFKRLGETWQDQEHAKFAEDFDRMVNALNRFVEASDKQVPSLMRKAEAAQNYLDQR
ncbi:MAG: WXG100 family type VII secretion target [Planctomycetota bacterium]